MSTGSSSWVAGSMAGFTAARGQPSFGASMERFAAIPELARRFPAARILFTGGVAWNTGGDDTTEAAVVAPIPRPAGDGRRARRAGGSCPVDPGQRAACPAAGAPAPWRALAPGHLGHAHAALDRRIPPRRLARAAALAGRLSNHRQAGLGGEPSMGARLSELDQAAYEWWGLLYYRLLGYTDAIFPAPV